MNRLTAYMLVIGGLVMAPGVAVELLAVQRSKRAFGSLFFTIQSIW
jgi:hypothetical protein